MRTPFKLTALYIWYRVLLHRVRQVTTDQLGIERQTGRANEGEDS